MPQPPAFASRPKTGSLYDGGFKLVPEHVAATRLASIASAKFLGLAPQATIYRRYAADFGSIVSAAMCGSPAGTLVRSQGREPLGVFKRESVGSPVRGGTWRAGQVAKIKRIVRLPSGHREIGRDASRLSTACAALTFRLRRLSPI